MNPRGVMYLLGRLLLSLAVALVLPIVVAWVTDGPDLRAFVVSFGVVGAIGLVSQFAFRQPGEFAFGRNDAFLLVTAAWVTASLAGALPFVLYHGADFAVDALFESASGFTTTGASILTDIESQPQGILIWRSLTHWLGGMGIIVLGIAILPKLAVGGMELLGAEAPGPMTEKLTPRIANTAKALWGIYAAFTLVETAVLMVLGMGFLDALNHAFATMATGGFSTSNGSVGGFSNPAIEWVIWFFMLVAGTNFALHYHWIRGRLTPLRKDPEFRLFIVVLAIATGVMTIDLLLQAEGVGVGEALRSTAFQSATIVTTTGFATVDYQQWPTFSKATMFLLMFVGGCAGSTGGSVKVARMMILLKKMVADFKRLVRPHAVIPVRVGDRAIPEEVVSSVSTFFFLFLTMFALGGLALALMGQDLVTAFSASAACIGNIGPGFDMVGPSQNYAFLPAPAKLVLVALMIVGRLELYTVLVLFFIWGRRR